MEKRTVHIVHCIDVEGPLYESLESTFERIREIFHLDIPPTRDNLLRLQHQEMDLKGLEKDVFRVVDPDALRYYDTWDKIDDMLTAAMAPEFRQRMLDSSGNGWVYNWHCMDHVGYEYNPRRRDMGFHNIFDHYQNMIRQTFSDRDAIHFHYHPIPFNRKAHHCASHYFANNQTFFQIIARRIIERNWFPSVNRPGFNVIRPDSHWFLEQFIPFDLSNQASDEDYEGQKDLSGGRWGDWRRAPKSWEPYHPAHDDYQVKGSCRRWIARCLNMGARVRNLAQKDVDQAFSEADAGKPVVMAFSNHDFRDIRRDVESVRTMIRNAATQFPKVDFRFSEAREAMQSALGLERRDHIHFTLSLDGERLNVVSDSPIFGPQPFLALRTRSGEFYHDNLDFQKPFQAWSYILDDQTFRAEALDAIGVGACDPIGNVTTAVMELTTQHVTTTYL
jgi:hypothetical protein